MDNNTRVATLESFRVKRYNKWVGVMVGLVLSMLLLGAGSAAYFSGIFVEASNDAPIELIISGVTDTQAKIEWTTNKDNQGLIEYGTSPGDLSLTIPETTSGTSHMLQLDFLRPATTYYFQIKVGDAVFSDAGTPWTFATKSEQGPMPTDVPVDVLPTAAPSQSPVIVTPTIPPLPTSAPDDASCPSTDCATIKSLLGNGCSVADYVKAKCTN